MNQELKIKNLETCLILVIAGIVAFLFKPEILLLYLAIALGLIGLFVPVLANIIRWTWYKIAELIGAITSRVMLGLIFFLFLTPIAILYRLFKKDQMKQNTQRKTYWVSRDHRYSPKDLENPW